MTQADKEKAIKQRLAQYKQNLQDWESITPDQIKAQYRRNLIGLKQMRNKAKQTGNKVNGYTLEQLNRIIERYTKLAQ